VAVSAAALIQIHSYPLSAVVGHHYDENLFSVGIGLQTDGSYPLNSKRRKT